MNLAAGLEATVRRRGASPALGLDGESLTYRDLDEMSARVAGLLSVRGVGPGDRVAVMLPNVPEFAVVYFGVLRAGGVVVPINPLLRQREVAAYTSDAEARLLLAWHAHAEVAEAGTRRNGTECLFVVPGEFRRLLRGVPASYGLRARDDGDTAVILYTAGTTGSPKGAELTHANLASNATAVSRMHALAVDDVTLGALPLYHAYGQTCALNATVLAGGRVELMPRFDPAAALRLIEREGVTVVHGVPTMWIAMLDVPGRESYDVSTLRICVSGGSAAPREVVTSFEKVFGRSIIEGYGLSETSPVAAGNRAGSDGRPGSIGRPIKGVEMRVLGASGEVLRPGHVGEIAVRGPNVMKGYWRRPDATAESLRDGWFHTGDLGWVDGDGNFFLADRMKDVIIRAGYTVYSLEVEEVLYEHPAVREAAVFGVPHPKLGEEVAAAVALREPADPGDLRAFVKERVAAYKYPRVIKILDELPKGPTGKILKRSIRELVSV